MVDKESVFVLGARDPEMREIAQVLGKTRRNFVHAARDGLAVSPPTAYAADGVVNFVRPGRVQETVLPPQAPAVLIIKRQAPKARTRCFCTARVAFRFYKATARFYTRMEASVSYFL